jgi:hypothetical protein
MSVDEYLRLNPQFDRERLLEIIRGEQRQEDDMVAGARATSLLDGVLEFELHLDRRRVRSQWPGVHRLTLDEVFVGHDPEAVHQARLRALALLGDAERYGDRALDRADPAQLPEEMRRDHPGFSEQSYGDALNWGMFLMR